EHVLTSVTPQPVWDCCPAWTGRAGTRADRPRYESWSGSTASMARQHTSGWRGSRWHTCIGYAPPRHTGNATPRTSRRGPRRSPSENGASRSRRASQDICASIPSIGAVVRKHIGFGYIAAPHAETMNQFHREHLNPYVNFHRPCAVPTVVTQANGKRRRIYRRWATPWESFGELPDCESFLRPGVTLA